MLTNISYVNVSLSGYTVSTFGKLIHISAVMLRLKKSTFNSSDTIQFTVVTQKRFSINSIKSDAYSTLNRCLEPKQKRYFLVSGFLKVHPNLPQTGDGMYGTAPRLK